MSGSKLRVEPQQFSSTSDSGTSDTRTQSDPKSSLIKNKPATGGKPSKNEASVISDQLYTVNHERATRMKPKREMDTRGVQSTSAREEKGVQTEMSDIEEKQNDGNKILQLFPEFSAPYIIEILTWIRTQHNLQRMSTMHPPFNPNFGMLGIGNLNFPTNSVNFPVYPGPWNNEQMPIGNSHPTTSLLPLMNIFTASYQQMIHENYGNKDSEIISELKFSVQAMAQAQASDIHSKINQFNTAHLMDPVGRNFEGTSSANHAANRSYNPTGFVSVPAEVQDVIVIDDSPSESTISTPERSGNFTFSDSTVRNEVEINIASSSQIMKQRPVHDVGAAPRNTSKTTGEQLIRKENNSHEEGSVSHVSKVSRQSENKTGEKKMVSREKKKKQETPTISNVSLDVGSINESPLSSNSNLKRTLSPSTSVSPTKKRNSNDSAKVDSTDPKLRIDMLGQLPMEPRRQKGMPRRRFSPPWY
uniref:Uncharacterized protein n=1 Tax=Caenorhabditis tropicalis TaxID=1561998 RepID=A0A1I7TEE6_9PELO